MHRFLNFHYGGLETWRRFLSITLRTAHALKKGIYKLLI